MAVQLSQIQEQTIEAPEINIQQLLECACEYFLPSAYHMLLGREPDAIGAIHYACRLQSLAPRQLILAEIRSSQPGQDYAIQAPSLALDHLVERYRRVRLWPMGRLRWFLLPRFDVNFTDDRSFDWERWANDYISQLGGRQVTELPAVPQFHSQGNSPSVELQILDLRDKVESLTTALEASVTALRARGEPEQVVGPLCEALNGARLEFHDYAQVSWEARQHLRLLLQVLRT